MKELIVKEDGIVIERIEFSGGYNIAYTNTTDSGNIRTIRKLTNARYSGSYWVKNYQYAPIADKLIKKFEELRHIKVDYVLFIEDQLWEPKNEKRTWIARIKKANKDLTQLAGYYYIMEMRKFYINNMSAEQVAALLYHELLHIDKDGDLRSHDIEDWGSMIATLGHDWATTKAQIIDILDDDFKSWDEMRLNGQQMNLWSRNVVAMRSGQR